MEKPHSRNLPERAIIPNMTQGKNQQPHFFRQLAHFCFMAIIFFVALLAGWILLLYLVCGLDLQPLPLFMLVGLVVMVGVLALLYHKNYQKLFLSLQRKFPHLTLAKFLRVGLILAIIFGLVARLSTLCLMGRLQFCGKDSDFGVNWYYAEALVSPDTDPAPFEETYVAFYPHLLGYIVTLTAFMGIFGSSYTVVILLNIAFDFLAVLALYILLRKWRDRNTACIGAILWLVNPLQILYCAISMSVVAINAFLVFTFLVGYFVFQQFKRTISTSNQPVKNLIFVALLSLLFGLTLCIGNAYRPIFSALLIAFILSLVVGVFYCGKKFLLPACISGLLCVGVFVGTNSGISALYAHVNPQYSPEVGIGWNVYVGANYDSRGHWTGSDFSMLRPKLWGEKIDLVDPFDPATEAQIQPANLAALQDELLTMGIERYQAMNPLEFISHLVHKTVVLFTGEGTTVPTMTWPFVREFGLRDDQPLYQLLHSVGKLIIVFSIALTLVFMSKIFIRPKTSNRKDPMVFWIALSLCGLIAASMLVEVMYRYFMPISVFFIVFAACELGDQISH